MKVGQFVEWDSSGGKALGKITQIVRDGIVPDIAVKITGTPEEPAARIQVYKENSEGEYEPTDTFVGHKISELRGTKSLSEEDMEEELTPRQTALVNAYVTIADTYGKFGWGTDSEGSHYTPAEKNPFKAEGLVCKNCALYAEDSQSCSIVAGIIEPEAICKFWVIENYELENGQESPEEPMETEAASRWVLGGSRNLPVVEDESWEGPAAQAQIFALAGFDTESPKPEIARRGFLVYDASAPTLKGSYKLPFAIVRNGRLVASRAGLRAAAQRLPQTDISSELMSRAQNILDSYKEKDKTEAARYSDIDFSPPDAVRSAAKRGLELHEKGLSGNGLEPATVLWARKYSEGQSVSPERARMGNRFYGRNARFANAPKDSPAWVSWLLWGGAAGKSWFSSLVRQMDNAEKKSKAEHQIKSSVHGFMRMAETTNSNPLLKEVELILTDFEANANKEGIPQKESANIIRTALHTPIKIAVAENNYAGHKGAIPVGPIIEVYEDTHNDKPVIKAKAIIWSDEFKEVYSLLKSQAGEREYIGTSWEVYYQDADSIDGVNWLNNVTFAGTCIVDVPAYGERTKLLKVAEKEMVEELQTKIKELEASLQEKENEINGLREENNAYKAEADAKAQAEKRQNVASKLVTAGFTQSEVDEKIEFYLQLPEDAFEKILADFVKTRTEASKKDEVNPIIPEPKGSHDKLDSKAIASGLKQLLSKK
jgi:hypothetical protein